MSMEWLKDQMTRDLILDRKLNQAKERIEYVHHLEHRKYQMLEEHIAKLEASVVTEHECLEALTEAKTSQVQLLDCDFALKIVLERQTRAEAEATSLQDVDQAVLPLVVEVAKLAEQRGEMQKRCVEEAGRDLQAFSKAIATASRQGEEEANRAERRMMERLDDLNSLLAVQRKVREESEVSLLQTFKEVSDKTFKDINMERRDREEGEKSFLRVMEGILARYGIYARAT